MPEARRTGTYIAFSGDGTTDPTASDIKYFNLLKAWKARSDDDFHFIDSHRKTRSVRDSSARETLRAALAYRLLRSKNLLLIVGPTTRFNEYWVGWEIQYAADECSLPIIVAYPGYSGAIVSGYLSYLWPQTLRDRIARGTVRTIHVPFQKQPIVAALNQISVLTPPLYASTEYAWDAYRGWGLV